MGVTSLERQVPLSLDTLSANTALDVNNDSNTSYAFTVPPPFFIPCDNPRNIVSPSVAEMVDLVVYAGILPVLVTCGVITNVINMAVFTRQGLSDRIRVCLFSLALSDAGYLLSVMSGKSYVLLGLVDPTASTYWKQLHLIISSRGALLGVSNSITLIIAAERCLGILSPLKAARFFRTRHTVVLITVMAVLILTMKHVGLGLKYRVAEVTTPLTNSTTFITLLTPLYLRHKTIIDIFSLHLVSVSLPCASLAVVVLCTIVIILRLRVTATWRRRSVSNMTSVEKQEMTLTRMLVTVCCVYIVCMTPSVTRILLVSRLPGFLSSGYLCNIYRVSFALVVVLEAVNASINFLVYVKQSSQYRSTLMQLCFRRNKELRKEGVSVERRSGTQKNM